jgi:hypothetical protein
MYAKSNQKAKEIAHPDQNTMIGNKKQLNEHFGRGWHMLSYSKFINTDKYTQLQG